MAIGKSNSHRESSNRNVRDAPASAAGAHPVRPADHPRRKKLQQTA
ncbi:MAG TPA: hypothetical protein VGN21_00600 [Stellaceae bacterium]|jgi:hypothetical protein|nr:hypothetical protein [Pseudolabrys sp.]